MTIKELMSKWEETLTPDGELSNDELQTSAGYFVRTNLRAGQDCPYTYTAKWKGSRLECSYGC